MGEPVIRRSDSVAIIGRNGSGKSVLAWWLFAPVTGQKIFINVKGDEDMNRRLLERHGEDNVCIVRGDVDAIDWTKPVIVYVFRSVVSIDECDALYAALLRRSDLTIWLDEAYGPTTQARIPDHLALVLQHGRSRNLRHLALMQRPVRVAPMILTEASHIIFYPIGFNARDRDFIAAEMGETGQSLRAIIAELTTNRSRYGDYPCLWYDRRANTIYLRPSVPFTG